MNPKDFKQFNKIGKRTKCAVYGWFRNKEKEFNITTVPHAIAVICILFARDDEIFDTICHFGIGLSENRKIISFIENHKVSKKSMKFHEFL